MLALQLCLIAGMAIFVGLFLARIVADKNFLEFKCRGELMENHRSVAKYLNKLLALNPRAKNLKDCVQRAKLKMASSFPPTVAEGTLELSVCQALQTALRAEQEALLMMMESIARQLPLRFAGFGDNRFTSTGQGWFNVRGQLDADTLSDIAPEYSLRDKTRAFYREIRLSYTSPSWNYFLGNFYFQKPLENERFYESRKPLIKTTCAAKFVEGEPWNIQKNWRARLAEVR